MICIFVYNSDIKYVMYKIKKKIVLVVIYYKVVVNSYSCVLLEVSFEIGIDVFFINIYVLLKFFFSFGFIFFLFISCIIELFWGLKFCVFFLK